MSATRMTAPVRDGGVSSPAVAPSSQSGTRFGIDPRTQMGAVRLTVADLDRARAFYERSMGLRATEREDGSIALGAGDRGSLVELHGDRSASPLDGRATGLFHLAVLMPTRLDLAFALARLAESRWPLDGAADHLVSEALYLSDPDGNGIEIYRDRPREEWGKANGQLKMPSLPLDLRSLINEIPANATPQAHAPAGTRIGHIHLQVAELEETEAFYGGVLGFDVMVRGLPGALFISAGGYHHHLGLNTWHSAGSGPPPPGAVGLRSFTVELPGQAELEAVLSRVRDAGLAVEPDNDGDGHLVRDPSGNAVRLRAS
jgi:catechol 2,3-dioxygenase